MTTTLIETPVPEPDPVAVAIVALTASARRVRVVETGAPDEQRFEPDGFGEIACRVITAVAANVGGVEILLSGRPGSWEADCVRQIVQGTVGDDDPLVATLAAAANAEERAYELWEQDQAAYREAYVAAIRQALLDRGLTLQVELVEPTGELKEWDLFDDLVDELHEHARKNAPLPMTGAAPDWSSGTPADALERAGLTYIARTQGASM